MTAKQIHAAIRSNVDAWYSGDIDHEAFTAENRRLLDLAAASKRKLAAVTKMVRERLPNAV